MPLQRSGLIAKIIFISMILYQLNKNYALGPRYEKYTNGEIFLNEERYLVPAKKVRRAADASRRQRSRWCTFG